MRWQIETWRKLYTAKPASWLALPVSARGLGRELLTYCDDKGRLPIGDEAPGPAVSRIISAHRHELKRIDADIADLLKDGYLIHDGAMLIIRNFVPAQERSSSAERQRRYRERLRAPPPQPPGDRNALRNGEALRDGNAVTTSDASRSDGSRSRSESPLPPAERGDGEFPDPEPGSVPSSPRGTPRQNGTSPRQTGTNPRASLASRPVEPFADPPPPPPRSAVRDCPPSPPGAVPAALADLFSDVASAPVEPPEEAVQ